MATATSVDAYVDAIGFGAYQWRLLILSGIAMTVDSMEVMILSFLGPAVQCTWPGTDAGAEAALTTLVFVGMGIGTLMWGRIADRSGRRGTVMASFVVTLVSGIVSAFSPSIGVLLAARLVAGIGIGGVPPMFALFLEVVPTSSRGFWASLVQSWWSIGTVIEAGLAWWLLRSAGWPTLLLASTAPLVVLVVVYWALVYESPRYLVDAGKLEEAERVLRRIAAINGVSSRVADLRLDAGSDVMIVPRSRHMGWMNTTVEALQSYWRVLEELLHRSQRRTTLLLWIVWLANALGYYGLVLLTTTINVARHDSACVGDQVSLTDSDFVSIFIDTLAEFPSFLLAATLADRIGRRWSQALGFAVAGGACVCLIFVPRQGAEVAQTAVLFVARAFSLGAFTVTYLFTPELYPQHMRATAFGFANLWGRVGGMLAPFVGQSLVRVGSLLPAEIVFAVVCLVGAASSLLLRVETAGKPLGAPLESDSSSSIPIAVAEAVTTTSTVSPPYAPIRMAGGRSEVMEAQSLLPATSA